MSTRAFPGSAPARPSGSRHRGHPGTWTHPSLAYALLGAFWLLGSAALVLTAAIGGVIVLQRARSAPRVMSAASAYPQAINRWLGDQLVLSNEPIHSH